MAIGGPTVGRAYIELLMDDSKLHGETEKALKKNVDATEDLTDANEDLDDSLKRSNKTLGDRDDLLDKNNRRNKLVVTSTSDVTAALRKFADTQDESNKRLLIPRDAVSGTSAYRKVVDSTNRLLEIQNEKLRQRELLERALAKGYKPPKTEGLSEKQIAYLERRAAAANREGRSQAAKNRRIMDELKLEDALNNLAKASEQIQANQLRYKKEAAKLAEEELRRSEKQNRLYEPRLKNARDLAAAEQAAARLARKIEQDRQATERETIEFKRESRRLDGEAYERNLAAINLFDERTEKLKEQLRLSGEEDRLLIGYAKRFKEVNQFYTDRDEKQREINKVAEQRNRIAQEELKWSNFLTNRDNDRIAAAEEETRLIQKKTDAQNGYNASLARMAAKRGITPGRDDDNETIIRSIMRLNSETRKLKNTTESFSIGRMFGEGSRNDFLNLVGKFIGKMGSFTQALVPANSAVGKFGSIIGMAATSPLVLTASLGALVAALMPVAAALSLAAGAAVAFVGAIGVAAVGALAALGPVVLAAGAAFGVLMVGFKQFDKFASDADKKTVKPLMDSFQQMKEAISKDLFKDLGGSVKTLTPLLDTVKASLTGPNGVASAVRETILNMAKMATTGAVGDNFKKLTGSLGGLTKQLGAGLTQAVGGLIGMLTAALPVANRFLTSMTGLFTRFNEWANSARGQNAMSAFFDKAYTSAEKVFKILGQLVKALATILDVGHDAAGVGMLDSMLEGLIKFNDYLKSVTGQRTLQQWFKDSAVFAQDFWGVLKSIGRLFNELDSDQSRNWLHELMQSLTNGIDHLTRFATSVRSTTAPASEVSKAFGNLRDAIKEVIGGPLKGLMAAFRESSPASAYATILNAMAGTLRGLAPLFTIVASAAGALMRAFSALDPLLQQIVVTMMLLTKIGMVSFLTSAGKAAMGLITTIRILAIEFSAVRNAATGSAVANFFTGIGGAATYAGGAIRGIGKAMMTMGPAILAMTAIAVVMSTIASKQQKAREAADKHKASVQSLTSALKESNGVMDVNAKMTLLNSVVTPELVKNIGKLSEKYGIADLNARTLSGAILGNASDQEKWSAAIHATPMDLFEDGMMDVMVATQMADGVSRDAADGFALLAEQERLAGKDAEKVTGNVKVLADSLKTYADRTQDATSRTDALTEALRVMAGGAVDMDTAAINNAKSIREYGESFTDAEKGASTLGQAVNLVTGEINTSSEAGGKLNDQMKDSLKRYADTARAAHDQAIAEGDSAGATKRATAQSEAYSAQLFKTLTSMGLSEQGARNLINRYGLIPQNVETFINQAGMPNAIQDSSNLAKQMLGLNGMTANLAIGSNSVETMQKIQTLSAELLRLGQVEPTVEVQSNMASIQAQLAVLAASMVNVTNNPAEATVVPNIDPAVTDVSSLALQLAGIDSTLVQATVTPETYTASTQMNDLALTMAGIDSNLVTATVTPDTAATDQHLAAVTATMATINASPAVATVVPNVGDAAAQIAGITTNMSAVTTNPAVATVVADTGTASAQLQGLVQTVNATNGLTASVNTIAPSAPGTSSQVQGVGKDIKTLDGAVATVKTQVPTAPEAVSQIKAVAEELTKLNGRVATATIQVPSATGAKDAIKAVIDEATKLNGQTATVYVSVDATAAANKLTGIQSQLNTIRNTPVNVTPPVNSMGGRIVNRPTLTWAGERGLREAIVPMDLPLTQVHPSVRPMAAMLRGENKIKSVPASPAPGPQKMYNVTLNVYPAAADPEAVTSSVLNRLTALSR